MKINNQIDTATGGDSLYLDTRDIKKEEVKIRLFGDAVMGYSYFTKTVDDKIGIVRSEGFPTMVNPTDGYQGAEQKPAKNFYVKAWNYATESPVLLTLDKVTLINPIMAVIEDPDLADVTDYDFKISFDDKKEAADKYQVTRLDKSDLTPEQTKALKEFDCDLQSHAAGGDAFVSKANEGGDVEPF